MNSISEKEYNVAITFYEKIISQFKADLTYYAALIRALHPKNILELGCGSGRLFPTYIHEGVKIITGIDISAEMLARAPTEHPAVNLFQGDIIDFRLDEKFDLIVISNSLLKHIEKDDDRIKILYNAKQHLTANGVISIDHSPYLYYVTETSDWFEAENSVIAEWIPNENNILQGYQWGKEVNGNKDIAKWRHFEKGKTNFEIQFSTYVYTFEDLQRHLNTVSLNYQQVMSDYLPKGLLPAGNRFIAILGTDKRILEAYSVGIRQELNAMRIKG